MRRILIIVAVVAMCGLISTAKAGDVGAEYMKTLDAFKKAGGVRVSPPKIRCQVCNGSGWSRGNSRCIVCNGAGEH